MEGGIVKLTPDIHDEMARSSQTHDLRPQRDGEDFGAIEPCRRVEHAIYDITISIIIESVCHPPARLGFEKPLR